MNVADLVVVAIAGLAGLSGWRSGILRSAFSAAGFIIGAVLGLILSSRLLTGMSGVTWFVASAALVVVSAGIGQGVAGLAGNWLKDQLSWKPIRVADSATGAAFGLLSLPC